MSATATKECPFCAETIQAAAVLCRFCGRELPPLVTVTAPAPALPLAACEAPTAVVHHAEVLDLLTSLVQKSLVVYDEDEHGQGRYRLLETVRQYSRDRLLGSGEGAAIRSRHQAFFLALAEEGEPELGGPDQAEWLDRLERERENLRAALEWAAEAADGSDRMLRLATATGSFWQLRFYQHDGADWLLRALQEAGGGPSPLRGKALFWAHVLGGGAPGDPLALLRESMVTYRQRGDKRGLIVPLAELA